MLQRLDGLERVPNLDTLNVSNNKLKDLPPLGCCPSLHTLLCSDNEIASLDALRSLLDNKQLTTLDLQNNKLADVGVRRDFWALASHLLLRTTHRLNFGKQNDIPVATLTGDFLVQFLEILKQLPDLRCVYLKGNPAVSAIRNYRKAIIAAIPTLTYLDDRPIFDAERRCAEAW